MPAVERITSMREVLRIVRHPRVREWFPEAQRADYNMPPATADHVRYYRVGQGMIGYFIHPDGVAEVHGYLLPGDGGPRATELIKAQIQQLFAEGVKTIRTVSQNTLAARKAQAAGLTKVGEDDEGYPIFEMHNEGLTDG